MKINRRKTRQVKVGGLYIGSEHPIAVQSMSNVPASEIDKGVEQALKMQNAGCDIFRYAVPDKNAVRIFEAAKTAGVTMPLVADIHFDYRLAVECAYAGADKIRINPGNIGGDDKVKEVVKACRANGLPIRIGVNSGSLEKEILAKYGSPTAEALAESALYHASLLEKYEFYDTVISIKASNPYEMIKANRMLAASCDYPLHLGVTEAGSKEIGSIKSAIGIGSLLCDGIGDTVRVSLTDKPESEIDAAKNIFRAVGIKGQSGMDIVSCPTCGRTKIDLISLVAEFERRAKEVGIDKMPIKVALMGCVVNGPGEAREADIGIAGGKGEAVLIKKGIVVEKIPEDNLVERLIEEIKKL